MNLSRTTIVAFLTLCIGASDAIAQATLCSWNLRDFGNSKDDVEIAFIAETIRGYDIVAIQEVVAGPGGAQAVARLGDQLNRMGTKWEYVVSDPTSGENSYKRERYAFLWKPSRVQRVGDPWLEKKYHAEINREPYFMRFKINGNLITLCTFHAITKSMNPETEVKHLKLFPEEYPGQNLLFCGDFNLPQSHTVFIPLGNLGYVAALRNQKTSLGHRCIEDDCLASEFDNIFYHNGRIEPISSSVNHFYLGFSDIRDAQKISDHVPVIFEFKVLPTPQTVSEAK
jgi:deoxyribonuclease-1-like protein